MGDEIKLTQKDKYFTFIRKKHGYVIKSVKSSMSGETYITLFGLRSMFDEYEKDGYKYISPFEYEKIEEKLLYIYRSEEE